MLTQWFEDAKLGIFIHWGIYAVKGISESWSFYNNEISYEDYMSQLDGFSAKNYDAEKWAELIKDSGARYAVLTSKHHDGVSLWDTKLNDLSVAKRTPAKRDLIKPFADAIRKNDIKLGIYFSLLDWSNPKYASVFNGYYKGLPNFKSEKLLKDIKAHPWEYPSELKDDFKVWEEFLEDNNTQLKEIFDNYKPDLIWFDGDWTRSAEQWKAVELRNFLHSMNPEIVINGRLHEHGDYSTPEISPPVIYPETKWELCATINDSWGFRIDDQNHKNLKQIIRYFVECISGGGNLLLDIGPKEDGTIPKEQEDILRGLGAWIRKNEEAIYETIRGIDPHYFVEGRTTLSKDKKNLYLFVYGKSDQIGVRGLRHKSENIKVSHLASKRALNFKAYSWFAKRPGILFIDIPEELLDENGITVLKIELDKEINLYDERINTPFDNIEI